MSGSLKQKQLKSISSNFDTNLLYYRLGLIDPMPCRGHTDCVIENCSDILHTWALELERSKEDDKKTELR